MNGGFKTGSDLIGRPAIQDRVMYVDFGLGNAARKLASFPVEAFQRFDVLFHELGVHVGQIAEPMAHFRCLSKPINTR